MQGNVRLIDKGFLYVDVGDITIKILNPYNYEPTNVEVVQINGTWHIKEFAPKKEKTKV